MDNDIRFSDATSGVSRRGFLQLGVMAGGGIALSGLLAACSSGSTSTGSGGKTLTLGFNRLLDTLDNKLNQFDAQVTVQRAVHQALTRVDGKDLAVVNVLAKSFTQTKPTEWTVQLQPGLVYSDGTPVKPQDLKTALPDYAAVTKAKGGFVGTSFPEFPTVEIIDDTTFKLITKAPVYQMDRLMANILWMPASTNKPADVDGTPGVGPYVVTSANKGSGSYTLKKNPKYKGSAAQIDTVKLRFIGDDATRVAALQSGQVDVIDSVPPDSAKQLQSIKDVTLIQTPGTRIVQLFFNFRNPTTPALNNVKVREALTYAVDGNSLMKNVLLGSVSAVHGVVPDDFVGAKQVGSYNYDPAKAKSMLQSAGAGDLQLTFIWESGEFFSDSQVMEALASMLGKVGVKVKLQEFQAGGPINDWRRGEKGKWDVLGNGYGNQTGLALTNLQAQFAGTAAMEKSHDAFLGYVQPAVAAAVQQAAVLADESARNEALGTAQQLAWNTWPCLWAFLQNNALAYRSRVKGIDLLPTNFYDLSKVSVS